MLIWHDVVLVVWVDGLMLRCHEDLFGGKLYATEVFQKVSVMGCMQVEGGEAGVTRLM